MTTPPVRGADDNAVANVASVRPPVVLEIDTARPNRADELHLRDILQALYRRRWVAIAALLIVVIPVSVSTFLATPVYEARTRLLIGSENPNVVNFKPIVPDEQVTSDYYQTQYAILQSRILVRKTLDASKLWSHPEFGGSHAGNHTRGSASILGRLLPSASRGGGSAVDDAIPPAAPPAAHLDRIPAGSSQIDAFLQRLTVTPLRNSRLVDVSFRSTDPRLATTVANSLAQSYIQHNLELRSLATSEASKWLAQQLEAQRKEVETSEAALQQYRERNNAVSLEASQNIVVQKLGELNTAVTRAKAERIQKESLYNELHAIQSDHTALDAFPAILTNVFIQQLKADLVTLQRQRAELSGQLGDRHPEMVKLQTAMQNTQVKLEAEIQKVVQSVRTEYLAAQAQEQALVAALEQQKNEASNLNQKAIGYGTLQRNAKSDREIFESLLQRAKETSIFGDLKTSNVRVMDPAELPQHPIYPRTRRNFLLALIAGGVLAAVMVFGLELLDNRITDPDEIKGALEVSVLGWVPLLSKRSLRGRPPLIHHGVTAEFAEAFRLIRSNLWFSLPEQRPQTLVVTSTGPNEGKTIVAANLAIGFAQAGLRVLLIDADFRQPSLHHVFHQPLEPGLSDLIRGSAAVAGAARSSDIGNLHVLSAGSRAAYPAECLESPRFRALLKLLSEQSQFDRVVIDTPPVLPVADACLVAHAATAVVFVIGSELTSRDAARAALEQLSTASPKFLGAVLNRVDMTRRTPGYWMRYRRQYTDDSEQLQP